MGDRTDDEAAHLARRVFDLVRAGDRALLQYIDDGVPVDLADADGNTLVMLAVHSSADELVGGLASRGADVGQCNHRGQSPLAVATYRDDALCVQVLLEQGADPDAGTPTARQTATMFLRPNLAVLLDAPPKGRSQAVG